MKPVRNITSRQMLNFQTRELLAGCNDLTPEVRYAQVVAAQQVRNFWFTATLEPQDVFEPRPLGAQLLARTPALSSAVVVTDLISLTDFQITISQAILSLEIKEYGGKERSEGLNHFGLSGVVPQRYILKYEKNSATAIAGTGGDPQGRFISYVPRLLAPYQQLECNWVNKVVGAEPLTVNQFLQMGVRSIKRVIPDRYFSALADRQIRAYIEGSRPETFFLEATLPIGDWPTNGTGETVLFKTPQMDRPLMVLGAASNVEGCQASLEDESERYLFTLADLPIADVPPIPNYNAPPLALWAPNIDFRNPQLYNMFPVPHVLKPGAQLAIRVTNGLRFNVNGNSTIQMRTRSEQDARIVFICRTV